MSGPSFAEVKERCTGGRFYAYVGFHDRLFAPLSIYFVWFFVRLGWSANAVCVFSGIVAMAGGVMIASANPIVVLVGSVGYAGFYLLDYVDGGVARYRGQAGIGGQYLDWLMHVVSGLAITGGLFAGALGVAGAWIVPFGIAALVATALTLDKTSMGWFTIAMHQQQQRLRGTFAPTAAPNQAPRRPGPLHAFVTRVTMVLLKEDYLIFVLPLGALLHLALAPIVDFRVVLIVTGGAVYFPLLLLDVWRLSETGVIEAAYHKLFFSDEPPNLPSDHFLQ